MKERGFQPQNSERTPEIKTPFVYDLIPLDRSDIQDIYIPPVTNEMLHTQPITPEYLISHSVIAVKHNTQAQRKDGSICFSIPEEGRSVPIDYNKILYADGILGQTIFIKGSGLSGYIPYIDRKRLTLEYATAPSSFNTPRGLYGQKSADEDILYSEHLLKNGFKTALPLGYVVLKPDTVLRYTEKYTNNHALQKISKIAYEIIEKNRDESVLYFRLGGNRRRLGFAGSYKFSQESLHFHEKTEQMFFQQGIRLMAEEMLNDSPRSQRLSAYYNLKKSEITHLLKTTKPHIESQHITDRLIRSQFKDMIKQLTSTDARADSLVQEFHNYVSLPNTDDTDLVKDIDTSLCWYDFEAIYAEKHMHSLLPPVEVNILYLYIKYFYNLKRHGLVPTSPAYELGL